VGKMTDLKISISGFVLIAAGLLMGTSHAQTPPQAATQMPIKTEKAIFAGGCFWCMEPPFDALPGVISTISGYTAGQKSMPTYQEVSAGTTGHTEALEVVYDPTKITYKQLLEVFWVNIDPVTKDQQFCDAGTQYRSGIYFLNDEQKKLALESKELLNKGLAFGPAKPVGFSKGVVTEVIPATQFWPAEEYHQNYYQKNPIRYKGYRYNCGRDDRLKTLWGAPGKK
jgi:peptide-methionine (S)-S-oxide reductase